MRILALALLFMTNACTQILITDTGSTNRPGMSVTLSRDQAIIEDRSGSKTTLKLDPDLHKRFAEDVEAAGPLNELKVNHCMKSASFGSRTFITYKGVRSPDLSCPGQEDPKAAALQKDLDKIMSRAHQSVPVARPR